MSFNSPEKWLRGLHDITKLTLNHESFNSPEKWLRGLPTVQPYCARETVSIPPRSGSGDYEIRRCYQYIDRVSIPPRSGSGDYFRQSFRIASREFQFPREVAQGTTVKLSSKKTPFLAPFNNILFSFHFSMNIFQDHLRTPDPFPRPPSLLPEPSGKNFFNLLSDNRLNLCVIIKEEPVHTLPARFFSPIQFFSSSISHKKSTTGRSPLPDP